MIPPATKVYLIQERHLNLLEGVLREFESVFLDIYSNQGIEFRESRAQTIASAFSEGRIELNE